MYNVTMYYRFLQGFRTSSCVDRYGRPIFSPTRWSFVSFVGTCWLAPRLAHAKVLVYYCFLVPLPFDCVFSSSMLPCLCQVLRQRACSVLQLSGYSPRLAGTAALRCSSSGRQTQCLLDKVGQRYLSCAFRAVTSWLWLRATSWSVVLM